MTVIDRLELSAAPASSPRVFRASPPVDDVLATIGDTPMVELRNLDTGLCRLFAKLENHNPGARSRTASRSV